MLYVYMYTYTYIHTYIYVLYRTYHQTCIEYNSNYNTLLLTVQWFIYIVAIVIHILQSSSGYQIAHIHSTYCKEVAGMFVMWVVLAVNTQHVMSCVNHQLPLVYCPAYLLAHINHSVPCRYTQGVPQCVCLSVAVTILQCATLFIVNRMKVAPLLLSGYFLVN